MQTKQQPPVRRPVKGSAEFMIRIGAVNIDTSHPLGFGEVMEKDDRARYVGVYNDSFRPDSEVEGFIRRFGLEKRCNTLEELAAMCDIGFIHGCDWDDHLRCAMPFIEQGKPVFIDKPLVGNLADCRRVEQLVKDGAVILGASSARYAYEVQQFLALPEEERGEVVNVFGTAGVDEFNYGVHIAEAIGGILGQGAQSVRYMGRGEAGGKYSESYFVQYENGKSAVRTAARRTALQGHGLCKKRALAAAVRRKSLFAASQTPSVRGAFPCGVPDCRSRRNGFGSVAERQRGLQRQRRLRI